MSLTWDGLDELKAQLRALPAELAEEAGQIVFDAANAAADVVVAGYPSRTGDLKKDVSVSPVGSSGPFGVRAVVRNSSKHAVPFEIGTQARHTALGANRGSMPANPLFSQTMQRKRREMYAQLKDLLAREGLVVSGDV